MSTKIRTTISKKNEYYIPKHRQLELVHHCMQYDMWEETYKQIDGYAAHSNFLKEIEGNSKPSDPTAKYAKERLYYMNLMVTLNSAVNEACNFDSTLSKYLFRGVTKGWSYSYMRQKYGIPYCRDSYYKAYRRFFYILDLKLKNQGYNQ